MSRVFPVKSPALYSNSEKQVFIYSSNLPHEKTQLAVKVQYFNIAEDANIAINEALSMTKLSHPGICKIEDSWLEQDIPGSFKAVLVMELMDGNLEAENNARKTRGEVWSETELLRMLKSLVEALSYAQQQGVSNRDIKPSNILVRGNCQEVKVADFGYSFRETCWRIYPTKLAGSRIFLSPELMKKLGNFLDNKTCTVSYDPYRSDVYSLGITFLSFALDKLPVQLLDYDSLPQTIEDCLASIQDNYPILTLSLRQMLDVNPHRPNFCELKELFTAANRPTEDIALSPPNPAYYQRSTELLQSSPLTEEMSTQSVPSLSSTAKACKPCKYCNSPVPPTVPTQPPSWFESMGCLYVVFVGIAKDCCSQSCFTKLVPECAQCCRPTCKIETVGGKQYCLMCARSRTLLGKK